MHPPFPYRLARAEPGIYTELYLPKKAQFQGALYETLTRGFRWEHVRRHFLDPETRPQIRELLERYPAIAGYPVERIEQLGPFEWGYSVYEVEGVYYSSEQDRALEETTQVVRIMFQPDLERLRTEAGLEHLERAELGERAARVLRQAGLHDPDAEADTRKIRELLERWKEDVALFLFGYLVFELTARIRDLHQQNETPLEEEIWVTSFWNLELSRVELRRT